MFLTTMYLDSKETLAAIIVSFLYFCNDIHCFQEDEDERTEITECQKQEHNYNNGSFWLG